MSDKKHTPQQTPTQPITNDRPPRQVEEVRGSYRENEVNEPKPYSQDSKTGSTGPKDEDGNGAS